MLVSTFLPIRLLKGKAQAIYEVLTEGSMPCDGGWPEERIALFKQWIDEGMAP